jgi:hypothetical protein
VKVVAALILFPSARTMHLAHRSDKFPDRRNVPSGWRGRSSSIGSIVLYS